MFDISQWLFGNGGMGAGGANPGMPNNQMNLLPQTVKNPLAGISTPGAGGMTPGANLGMPNPAQVPAYAKADGVSPTPLPNRNATPGAPGMGAGGAAGGQSDSLRKAMLMQYLMGGGDDQPMNAISGGQAGGEGLHGTGGGQNDPRMGMLNSFPPMPQRRPFLGSGG